MDQQNPYAAPQTRSVPTTEGITLATGYWRSGRRLVVMPDAVLPVRCVKCNQSAEVRPQRFKLHWHPSWIYLVLLIGPIPYALVAITFQKKLTVTVGVCRTHVIRRRWAVFTAWMILLVGIAGCFVGGTMNAKGLEGLVILASVVVMLLAACVGVLAFRIVWPRRITKELGWIDGVCPEYLAELPEHEGAQL